MADGDQAWVDAEVSIVWQQLSEQIDAFIAAWASGEPPNLAAYLPASPPSLRRMTLIEAVKVDLEHRWREPRRPKTIEQYLIEFPELADDAGPPSDLIYEELHVRRLAGESVTLGDCCRRFPGRAEELRRLMPGELSDRSVSLASGGGRVPTFEAGQQVDDFQLLVVLGRGAFATVFLARQVSMQRLVALKISRDRGSEPQTLAQLDHPNIVRVYDQRTLSDRKLLLMYMQYVAGGTLHDVVAHTRKTPALMRSGRTFLEAVDASLIARGESVPSDSMTRHRLRESSWPEVVSWIGARLAAALGYAHARGVLHRDVKPANVLVAAEGHPKLADFNISFSKLDGATPAAYFGGSLAYMSPEQLEACDPSHARQPDQLDGRADVYSLGVMLWELLALERPFAEQSLPNQWGLALGAMTSMRRAGVQPSHVVRLPEDCPGALKAVLLKCLAPEPADRYASADELARELDLCLQPRAQSLLDTGRRWRTSLMRHALAATIGFGVLPNIVMSALNIAYNWNEILQRLGPDERRVFQLQLMVINGVAYAIGLGYVCVSRGRLFIALAKLARGEPLETPPSYQFVQRALSLGLATAIVTVCLWSLSGLVFPAWLHASGQATSGLSSEHFAHFLASNLLCGLIAGTQTYYVITFFVVRFCYPWLIRARTPDAREIGDLASLARWGRIFLAITVSVPFLALAALVSINFDRAVIASLCGLGLLGCGLAFWLDLTIRGDLTALAASLNPDRDALLANNTIESYLTGSRRR